MLNWLIFVRVSYCKTIGKLRKTGTILWQNCLETVWSVLQAFSSKMKSAKPFNSSNFKVKSEKSQKPALITNLNSPDANIQIKFSSPSFAITFQLSQYLFKKIFLVYEELKKSKLQ